MFCGFGPTLLAAKLAGRRFFGIELDARYCSLRRERVTSRAVNGPAAFDVAGNPDEKRKITQV
jgi:DNA modification methylase